MFPYRKKKVAVHDGTRLRMWFMVDVVISVVVTVVVALVDAVAFS